MGLIEEVKARIRELGGCSAATTMAEALASACSLDYAVSFFAISVRLDKRNNELVSRLMHISREDDFSNADQDLALAWLRNNNYI